MIQVAWSFVQVRVGLEHDRDTLAIGIEKALEALPKHPLPWFQAPIDQVLALVSKIIAPFF